MASQDPVELEHQLLSMTRGIFANFCIALVAVGVNIFMALYGLSVFLETPNELKKGRRRYIAMSFILTILSAMTSSLDIAWFFNQVFGASSGIGFFENLAANQHSWERMTSTAVLAVIIFLGDVLLVYRCYIIYIDRRWVVILPILTCLSALALAICQLVIIPRVSGDPGYESAMIFLTASTNIIVTALISFHLIRARCTLSKVLNSQQRDLSVYTGVVAILVESAAPLTVFGIIYAGLDRVSSFEPDFTAAYVTFGALFYAFAALSPHMIIFRVTTGRSWLRFPTSERLGNESGEDDEKSSKSAPSDPIRFAYGGSSIATAESRFIRSVPA